MRWYVFELPWRRTDTMLFLSATMGSSVLSYEPVTRSLDYDGYLIYSSTTRHRGGDAAQFSSRLVRR